MGKAVGREEEHEEESRREKKRGKRRKREGRGSYLGGKRAGHRAPGARRCDGAVLGHDSDGTSREQQRIGQTSAACALFRWGDHCSGAVRLANPRRIHPRSAGKALRPPQPRTQAWLSSPATGNRAPQRGAPTDQTADEGRPAARRSLPTRRRPRCGSCGRYHPGSTEWQAHRAVSAGDQEAAGTARSARSLPPCGTHRGKALPPPSGLHPMVGPPVSEAGRLRGHCHRAEYALAPARSRAAAGGMHGVATRVPAVPAERCGASTKQ
ncbi:hypothetical protein PVAP13_2KG168632 [Panicum virgatum]|uniref:Uncharacterized protein n=1 Tax=Panicum virgatum TaxID=38727 RepID=A0A8T0W1B2_PANVG|nr:hypothetical protein PVAP13_2KG168632 [Panicum virgatum]